MIKAEEQKAVFFDRDGVINIRIPGDYIKNLGEFIMIPEIASVVEIVKKSGYLAIIITNQQGIGKGLMTENDLDSVHEGMQIILENKTGYRFDDIFYCPDLAESGSFRRKPAPGMILEAAQKYNINLGQSFFIGDSKSDIEAANAANVKSIYIGNRNEDWECKPDYAVSNHNQLISLLNNIL